MTRCGLTESMVEEAALAWLESFGYADKHGPDIAPGEAGAERSDYAQANLVFLWLSTPELAVERVRLRVDMGGHSVPEGTIRRRYAAGLRNFFRVYQPLATIWRFYDNSQTAGPRLIASGQGTGRVSVRDRSTWEGVREGWAR